MLADAVKTCCDKHFDTKADKPDILWVCYDTPLTSRGHPDVEWVLEQINGDLPDRETLVLVSSQVPVGTIRRLEHMFPHHSFACSPENVRVATAVSDFTDQARIVVGRRNQRHDNMLAVLLSPFTKNIIWTDPETAEMVKHALNCYLAMSIAFINEVARVSKAVGADANTVSLALLCERRISPNAPLKPGAPFGQGHLERDLYNMTKIASSHGVGIPVIDHINESNELHKRIVLTM